MITGRIHGHPDGFGFLLPEDGGAEDLYLNRREMRRAMHGDRALVRIEKDRRGGSQARIVQILERGYKRIIGTYEKLEGRNYLSPMDPRLGPPLKLTRGMPEAKQGSVIAGEIVKYGTPHSAPEGKAIEVLGDPDDPEVQAQAIIFRYGLPTTFSPEAKDYASSCAQPAGPEVISSRVDLRALPTVTIDGESARDFDDAVGIEKKNGLYRLTVSIADVAHYVKPGTALDQEAYQRGTSVYFPDRAIPMLPEELSNGICSLNPLEERLTQSVLLEIDSKGEIWRETFSRSVIRSHARLTYTEVRRILVDGDAECIERRRELVDPLKRMEELARILWEKRKAVGSLDFDLPQAEIILNLQGIPEDIVRAERNIAHRIIEEFMIAANEAVARHLTKKGYPTLYRVHEGPEEESLR
ncbi:MAG: VacB/RNase II family 3'-5' exoribonuclease, partial [Nitrospinota bacterium]|nr:VacB/RNase II family 3'-5' exoribonuclease [Nitrospinota bacterium]